MLKISKVDSPVESKVVLDDYVPLTVEWERLTPVTPVYWRTGDLKSSLVEVGVDPRTGHMFSVTVTLLGAMVELLSTTLPQVDVMAEIGHPVLETLGWEPGMNRDEPAALQVQLHSNAIRVLFGSMQPMSLLVDGNVCFYLSSTREILGFAILSISETEHARFEGILRWSNTTEDTGGG